MIEEDYVSFKTAKLLKEKGVDECCHLHYHYNESFDKWFKTSEYIDSRFKKYYYPCPTLQMVMKWLREERKINIEIFTYWSIQEKAVYGNRIVSVEHANVFKEIDIAYDTYEQACEAAIKYCLENLI